MCLLSYMKTKILSTLDSFPYFTMEAVKQILGDESAAAGTIQTALYRWMKAGQIIQLKKGVYMTLRFFERHRAEADFAPDGQRDFDPPVLPVPGVYPAAQRRSDGNYLLGIRGYPESKPGYLKTNWERLPTAISRRTSIRDLHLPNTRGFHLPGRRRPRRFLIFSIFAPGSSIVCRIFNLAEELRLNLEDFSETDRDEFARFVELSKSRKMDRILSSLRKTVWRH